MSSKEAKIFISYSRANSDFAVKLGKDLRAADANIWIDQLDVLFFRVGVFGLFELFSKFTQLIFIQSIALSSRLYIRIPLATRLQNEGCRSARQTVEYYRISHRRLARDASFDSAPDEILITHNTFSSVPDLDCLMADVQGGNAKDSFSSVW